MREKILSILKKEEFEYYGLRIDDFEYSVGDTCNNSHELFQDPMYDDNDNPVYPEGEGIYEGYYDAGELDGTSCIKVTAENIEWALDTIKQYMGEHIYLIAGDGCQSGNDIDEIIISNATVILKK